MKNRGDHVRGLIIRMRDVYKEQFNKLKTDWKNGSSNHSNQSYKKRLKLYEDRIKEYDEWLKNN